ncbi:MAG: DUF3383 domain-containing protein [Bacteroidales bacterium]|nr:DUF3383 domain-containing protein [Bacteroidales bacterium]
MAIKMKNFVDISSTRANAGGLVGTYTALLACAEKGTGNYTEDDTTYTYGKPTQSGVTYYDKDGEEVEVKPSGTFYSYGELVEAYVGLDLKTDSEGESTTKYSFISLDAQKTAAKYFSIAGGNAALSVVVASDASAAASAAKDLNYKIAFTGDSSFYSGMDGLVDEEGGCVYDGRKVNSANVSDLTDLVNSTADIKFASKTVEDVAIIPAIFCSTNYSVQISQYCFKQGGTALVTTDGDYDNLKNAHINFIGQVKKFGTPINMLLMGVTSKGQDLSSYFGDIWLRDQVTSNVFETLTSQVLTAGNGAIQILSAVKLACMTGRDSGVIVAGKEFTDEQITEINSLAQANDAADAVSTDGFWINTWISESAGGYTAHYLLIYADSTGVKKVVGSHNLK